MNGDLDSFFRIPGAYKVDDKHTYRVGAGVSKTIQALALSVSLLSSTVTLSSWAPVQNGSSAVAPTAHRWWLSEDESLRIVALLDSPREPTPLDEFL